MKREGTIHASWMPAQQRKEVYASLFLHANAAQCSQKRQSLARVFMQQLEQTDSQESHHLQEWYFLEALWQKDYRVCLPHGKAVKNGWKFKITSTENQLFLTLSQIWIYKMPLLASPAINDIYIGYVFKINIHANKILIGCKYLVLKNLKAKTTNN